MFQQILQKDWKKNRKLNKGVEIKLAKINIRKQIGGSLLSTILTLGRSFAPTLAKTLELSALAGLAYEGASQMVKKISGGFLVPNSKREQLKQYKHMLTNKQKQYVMNSLQSGFGVSIKLTDKTQQGGFLGTLLASIAAPLAIEAIKKVTGNGAPKIGKAPKSPTTSTKDGGCSPRIGLYQPPPFFGTWEQMQGKATGMET